jgi:thioredoxin-like negative regulator of GroEL
VPALEQVGDSLINLGKFDQARAIYAQMPANDVFRLTSEGILDEHLGKHEASQLAARKIAQIYDGAASYQLAQLQAQRGARDVAFAALEQALTVEDPGLISLPTDPYLDPLRSGPRFAAIRSKIDFPPGLPG